jgi:hypothetical protein
MIMRIPLEEELIWKGDEFDRAKEDLDRAIGLHFYLLSFFRKSCPLRTKSHLDHYHYKRRIAWTYEPPRSKYFS